MSGPLSRVLQAMSGGASSLTDISARTGLDADVVRAAVDQLVRMGRVDARELAMGCPSSGCGSCASGGPDGAPGCGSQGPSAGRRGPALVALTLRPRD